MKNNKIKLRPVTKHFGEKIDGKPITHTTYCIEILNNRHWYLLGDDDGILKFSNRFKRAAKLVELNKEFPFAFTVESEKTK